MFADQIRNADRLLTGTEGWGYGTQASSRAVTNTYTALGRISTHFENITCSGCSPNSGTTGYSYDAAGNSEFESYVNGASVTTSERRSFFGADDKILAVDRRTPGKRMLEEYRYDALGRRIWVRQRTQCEPLNDIACVNAFVRRTVWDGNQEIAEIQAPYGTANATIAENDSGWALRNYNAAAGSYGDPNPFYGRVAYGPALGTDQPVSVTRYDYRDNPNGASSLTWPRYTLSLFWNYRGSPVYGLLSDGKYNQPYTLGGGQTACPVLGDQSTQRCVLLTWPDAQAAYNRNRGNVIVRSWQGTLLEEKRDGSGLQYLRNRSYDPSTGRFTQEDPIGLGGGLNAYGFARSDPVNFGDPFGLCPDACVVEGGAGLVALGVGLMAATTALAAGDKLGDALSQGVDAARSLVGSVFAAVSTKIHEAHLAGQAANIETHFGWLGGSDPGKDPNRWGDKWKNDIRKGIRLMRDRVERIKSEKVREKWIERITDLERRLGR